MTCTSVLTRDPSRHFSPLIRCALLGGVAVLDGVQRIAPSVFATLQSLIFDRELTLFDGTRLVHHERYAAMRAKASEEELTKRCILRVHPSFRIIGTPRCLMRKSVDSICQLNLHL